MKTALVLLPMMVLTGCSGGAADPAAAPDPVASVRTASVIQGAITETVEAYGSAEAGPGNERSMTIQAEATLARILAPTGTAVRPGQVVAVLTPSANARLESAKANSDAAAADAALARAIRLRADGLVSDADVETARAAARTANATSASTARRNGTLVLRAPAAGTVQNLTAKLGDLIAPGTTVATIGLQGPVRARFGIDPAVAARIRPGQPLTLSTLSDARPFTTTVVGVDPQVDATTRLAAVFALIPAGTEIGAGEPLRATIGVADGGSAITIPYAALLDDGGRSYVFAVKGGVAREVEVAPGNSAGDRIAILKGIQAGDRVVIQGGTALEDGMKVREADRAGTTK